MIPRAERFGAEALDPADLRVDADLLVAAGLDDRSARLLISRERAPTSLLWEVLDAEDRAIARTLSDRGLLAAHATYPNVYEPTDAGHRIAAALRTAGRPGA